jgi:hypothetical protein
LSLSLLVGLVAALLAWSFVHLGSGMTGLVAIAVATRAAGTSLLKVTSHRCGQTPPS